MTATFDSQCEIPMDGEHILVCCQGRWNFAARVHRVEVAVTDANLIHAWYFTDIRVIRNWGTTQGIGELVEKPLPNTRLDKFSTDKVVCVPGHAVIFWTRLGAGWS